MVHNIHITQRKMRFDPLLMNDLIGGINTAIENYATIRKRHKIINDEDLIALNLTGTLLRIKRILEELI